MSDFESRAARKGFGTYSQMLDANAQQQAQSQPYGSFAKPEQAPVYLGSPKAAKPDLGPNQTNAEADERNVIAAQRINQALAEGRMDMEQAEGIRMNLGIDEAGNNIR